MPNTNMLQVCRSCGCTGTGNYCRQCGQAYSITRITLSGLLHDVFHFFTHLDKGFGYTVKQLLVAPGRMQLAYIHGERARHQKPFSMFFICATIAALSRYWIFSILLKYYHTGNSSEATFFHEYMVLLHIALMPLNTLIVWMFFRSSTYNYAEIGVFMLYTVSIFFLMAAFISLLKLIWLDLDTAYIELPVMFVYNAVTFINFFQTRPRWLVVFKSLVILVIMFFLIQYLEDFAVDLVS